MLKEMATVMIERGPTVVSHSGLVNVRPGRGQTGKENSLGKLDNLPFFGQFWRASSQIAREIGSRSECRVGLRRRVQEGITGGAGPWCVESRNAVGEDRKAHKHTRTHARFGVLYTIHNSCVDCYV